MKSKLSKILVILSIGIISCGISPNMNFELKNHSSTKISKIQISATGSEEVDTIEFVNDRILKYKLNMSGIPKTDGAYKIKFERDGKLENKIFGYYTNGYPINEKYFIEILDNEVIIKEE